MKKFIDCLTDFFSSIAKARTAAGLARLHRYDDAVAVMTKK